MFETLTITLREGIEAALVIGIILAYLGMTNKGALKKYVFARRQSRYQAKMGPHWYRLSVLGDIDEVIRYLGMKAIK